MSKPRIRLSDKEIGTIHRLLCSWTPETRPSTGGSATQKEDWDVLHKLTERASGDNCWCGDSCTCGG